VPGDLRPDTVLDVRVDTRGGQRRGVDVGPGAQIRHRHPEEAGLVGDAAFHVAQLGIVVAGVRRDGPVPVNGTLQRFGRGPRDGLFTNPGR
jgi:hypothetical protein